MKLLNFSFTKPRYWVLGLGLAAGAGTAQAQFTGIGTTTPGATLHVVNSDTATTETLDIDYIKNLRQTEKTSYTDVLVYDPASGLFRRESVADLLDDNGEFVYDGTTAGAETLMPRRSTVADEFTITNGTGIGIANNLDLGGNAQVDGNVDIDGTTAIGSTLNVTGATTLQSTLNTQGNADFDANVNIDGTLTVGTVANAAPPEAADKILIQQDGADLVEHVTVEELLQNNGEWRVDDVAAPTYIYAFRAKNNANDNDVAIVEATGNLGIGTTTASDKLQIVGGGIDVDADQGIEFGAIGSLVGDGTDLDLTATGVYTQAITGAHVMTAASSATTAATGDITTTATAGDITTIATAGDITTTATAGDIRTTATAGSIALATAAANEPITLTTNGQTVTLNDIGLGIGVVATTGRHLQVDQADGVQFGSLTGVTDVVTQGNGYNATTNPGDFYDRILITDSVGVIRYINVDDLISDAGEWAYEDNGTAGITADDRIYVRRLDETSATDDAVYVDGVGNMVLDATKAYQWGGTDNQIDADGLTVDGAYTFTTGDGSDDTGDVTFQESGSAVPWLFFDSDDGTGGTGTNSYLGKVGIGTGTPTAALHVVGNIVASHTSQTSDRRFKRDIQELDGALEAIDALRGVSYEFRKDEFPNENFDDATHIGFIAQELQEILPQAVFERNDGFLTVDYASVTPVLVEAVQELSTRIETLEAENAALRGTNTDQAVGAVSTKQLQELEARLAAMDARLEAATAGRK